MKKNIFIFIITVVAAFNFLTGCGANEQYQALKDNKDSIFMISLDETLNDSLNGIGEISSDITTASNKTYKFIILSETEAEKIISYADTETLKNKIFDGFALIYYQQDKAKLNSFMRKFYLSQNLETGSNNVLMGCVLHQDINYVLKSDFVNGHAVFYNTDVSAVHFLKAQMQEIIRSTAGE